MRPGARLAAYGLAAALAGGCGTDPAPPTGWAGATANGSDVEVRAALCTGAPNRVEVRAYDARSDDPGDRPLLWAIERTVPDERPGPTTARFEVGRVPAAFREVVPLARPLAGGFVVEIETGRRGGAPGFFFDTALLAPGRVAVGTTETMDQAAFLEELAKFCDEVG